jgi:hypothetical protein
MYGCKTWLLTTEGERKQQVRTNFLENIKAKGKKIKVE